MPIYLTSQRAQNTKDSIENTSELQDVALTSCLADRDQMEQEEVLGTKDEEIHEDLDYLDLKDQQGEVFTKEHTITRVDHINSIPAYLTVKPENVVLSGDGDAEACVSTARLTVLINDMPFEVVAGLFNVKEAYGNDAVLINSFGQPILTDEFGVIFQPFQGVVYYLI